jgi:hypothetical protein
VKLVLKVSSNSLLWLWKLLKKGGQMLRLIAVMFLLASPIAILDWWLVGVTSGFHVWDKIPPKMARIIRRCFWLTLLCSGAGGSAAFMRGCVSLADVQAAAASVAAASAAGSVTVKPQQNYSLGKVTLSPPPFKILTRLREETAKSESEKANARKAAEKVVAQAAAESPIFSFVVVLPNGQRETITMSNADATINHVTPKNARSGPFCRVTCAAHHGGEYDVETVPELCRANWIPPRAEWVPGWYELNETKEMTSPWPGPAQVGFEKYKLYWSDLQSAAKVVHRSESLAGPKS